MDRIVRYVCAGAFATMAACAFDFDRFGVEPPPEAPPLDAGEPRADASAAPDDRPVPVDDGGGSAPGVDASDAGGCDEVGLLARWRFDEDGGTKVSDCTSSGLNGTVAGTPKWVAGQLGGALELDQNYASFGSPTKSKITTALTVTGWIKVLAFPTNGSAYVVGKTTDLLADGWRLAVEPTGVSFAASRGLNKPACVASGTFTSSHTWVHVAGVYQPGTDIAVYIDGVATGHCASEVPAALIDVGCDLRVGARSDGVASSLLRGVVDDVRVYDRALTAAEVAALAKAH